jgi:hypothetical protein
MYRAVRDSARPIAILVLAAMALVVLPHLDDRRCAVGDGDARTSLCFCRVGGGGSGDASNHDAADRCLKCSSLHSMAPGPLTVEAVALAPIYRIETVDFVLAGEPSAAIFHPPCAV